MIASPWSGCSAFVFFFKYRERRARRSRRRWSIPTRGASRSLVISVPLFFFLLWFVHGFSDYVWCTTPPPRTRWTST